LNPPRGVTLAHRKEKVGEKKKKKRKRRDSSSTSMVATRVCARWGRGEKRKGEVEERFCSYIAVNPPEKKEKREVVRQEALPSKNGRKEGRGELPTNQREGRKKRNDVLVSPSQALKKQNKGIFWYPTSALFLTLFFLGAVFEPKKEDKKKKKKTELVTSHLMCPSLHDVGNGAGPYGGKKKKGKKEKKEEKGRENASCLRLLRQTRKKRKKKKKKGRPSFQSSISIIMPQRKKEGKKEK